MVQVLLFAKRHQARLHDCESIIDAARKISSIKSRKGRPRLITARRQKTTDSRIPLSPSPPRAERDYKLAIEMIQSMRPLLSKQGELGDIAPTIELFLQRVEANNSGVRFSTPEQAKPFVTLLARIAGGNQRLFSKHIFAESSTLPVSEQRGRWAKALGITVLEHQKSLKRDGGRYGEILVSVELGDSKERRNSAHAYKYVLHLAAIALLARGRIRIPSNTGV